MGKIGKKTKKFVKKHLKTVIKNRRKFKSIRDSDKRKHGGGNNGEEHLTELSFFTPRFSSEMLIVHFSELMFIIFSINVLFTFLK